MKLLITGANGFLGRHVVAEALNRGHEVRAMVRPAANINGLPWRNRVEIFRADLRCSENLTSAFDGCDALLHLAAAVSGADQVQFACTVQGTERLLTSMSASSTRKLVLCSSLAVYDFHRAGRVLDEESPLLEYPYEHNGYSVAKVWQERVTRSLASREHWDLTVLRPGFIWGKGNEFVHRSGQIAGPFSVVFGPGSDAALTHVENCSFYFLEAVEDASEMGATFNVIDGHHVGNWKYMGHCQRGHRIRIPVPYRLGYWSTRLIHAMSKWTFQGKGKLPSILTPCRFEARFKAMKFSTRKLFEQFGNPPHGFDSCLSKTFAHSGGAVSELDSPAIETSDV